jgi:hypothetical protein
MSGIFVRNQSSRGPFGYCARRNEEIAGAETTDDLISRKLRASGDFFFLKFLLIKKETGNNIISPLRKP